MIKKKYWVAVPMVGCLAMLTGCSQALSDALWWETNTDSGQRHKVTRDLGKENFENLSKQHKKMHPEAAADIDKLMKEYAAKFVQLEERANNIHSSVQANVDKIAAAALRVGKMLVGLPDGGSVAGFVAKAVGTASDKAEAKTDKVATEAKDARTVMLASLRTASGKLEKEVKDQMARIAATEKEAADNLAKLKEETQERLAGATDETYEKLTAAMDKRAEFEKIMRDELKLSPEELENLKGMTTEQILAMIVAAGGAAGIGVAGGRGGKSRGHAELERLKEMVAKVKAEIERAKPPLT